MGSIRLRCSHIHEASNSIIGDLMVFKKGHKSGLNRHPSIETRRKISGIKMDDEDFIKRLRRDFG